MVVRREKATNLSALFDLAFKALLMKRWNNRPVVEITTEAGSVFSSAVALLILKPSMDEITLEALEKMFFRVLPKCVLSDISYDTKQLIMEENDMIWSRVYNSAVKEVERILPEELRPAFSRSIQEADPSVEKLLSMAGLVASDVESWMNHRLFPEFYEEVRLSIEAKKNEILSADDRGAYNLALEILKRLRPMVHSWRWNLRYRHLRTSVADHSFYVVFVTLILAKLMGMEKSRLSETLMKALFHDVPESFTGDIISPTKRRVEGFEDVLKHVEKKILEEKLIPLIPDELKERVLDSCLNPFTGESGRLVRSADLFAGIKECDFEISTGNMQDTFLEARKNMMKELKDLGTLLFFEEAIMEVE